MCIIKPIQENYIKPDSRVQNLVESNTKYATLMEKAIVMAYNMKKKGRSEAEAANLGGIEMKVWKKEKEDLNEKLEKLNMLENLLKDNIDFKNSNILVKV